MSSIIFLSSRARIASRKNSLTEAYLLALINLVTLFFKSGGNEMLRVARIYEYCSKLCHKTSTSDPPSKINRKTLCTDPLLLAAVAVADRHCVVFQCIKINRDTERCADF